MDIASLGLRIETGQVKAGVADLDKLASAGAAAEKSSQSLEKATKATSSSLAAQRSTVQGATKNFVDLSKATTSLGASSYVNFRELTTSLGATAFQAKAATSEIVNLDKASKKAADSTDGLARAGNSVRSVLQAIGVAVTVRELVAMADAATNLESRLKLVTNSSAQLATVQNELFAIAQNSRVGLVGLGTTYAQIARSTNDLGISQKALLEVTKTISQAVTISGGTAESSNAALVQLSQGFASGALRGEELNSVLEQTPRLAQAIAQGLGVSIGKLREMGSEGKLTAEAVLGALQKAAPAVADEFAKMTPTVEQSLTKINNSLIVFIGNVNKLTGATNGITTFFGALSRGLDSVSADMGKMANQGGLRDAAADVIRLSNASKELQQRASSGGAFGKDFNQQLKDTNAQLEVAKKRFRDLNTSATAPSGPTYSDFPSRSQSLSANDARMAKSTAELTTIRRELAGVDKDYLPTLEKLQNQRRAGNISEAEYVKLVSEVATQTYKKTEAGKADAKSLRDGTKATNEAAAAAKRLGKGELGFDIGAIKNALDATNNAYANADKLLEARRAASLLGEREFYAEKKRLLEQNSQAQDKALQDEISRLQQETFSGKNAGAEKFENDKKIADAQEKLNKSRANGTTNLEVLKIRETEALAAIERGYADALAAAQSYLDVANRARDAELSAMGQGSRGRDSSAAISQITEKYEAQRQDLQRDNRNGKFAGRQGDFARELALLNEFQEKSISSYLSYYERLGAIQGNFSLGASEALKNYFDESRDIFKQTEEAVSSAFKGMEDALTSFITTGKLDFNSLANSIVTDITRIIVKQALLGPLAQSIGGLLGGGTAGNNPSAFVGGSGGGFGGFLSGIFGSLLGGRAIGGPVSAGGLYRVNENRPEMLNVGGKQFLMMGNQGGSVDPNTGGSGPAVNQTVNFYNNGPVDRRTQQQIAAQAASGAQRALARNS